MKVDDEGETKEWTCCQRRAFVTITAVGGEDKLDGKESWKARALTVLGPRQLCSNSRSDKSSRSIMTCVR